MAVFTDESIKGAGLIKGTTARPCIRCSTPTHWIEVCSEAHMCSDECLAEFYREYDAHCRSHDEEEPYEISGVDVGEMPAELFNPMKRGEERA